MKHVCFFFTFFALTMENPALTVSVLLTLAVLVVNGWTDAPSHRRGVVTGALSFRRAVALAGQFSGVLCVSGAIGGGSHLFHRRLPEAQASLALCAAMGSVDGPAAVQRATPSLSGAALARSLGCIRWQRWGGVLLGLVLS